MAAKTKKPATPRPSLADVRRQYPSIDALDWERLFTQDIGIFGRILADAHKSGTSTGRPGPRADIPDGTTIDHIIGEEYTMLPFREIVPILSRGMSVRRLEEKTGINRNAVHKLLTGKVEPDNFELKQFATAFGKRPSFFVEYRIGYVLSFLHTHMSKYPESSVAAFDRLHDRLGREG